MIERLSKEQQRWLALGLLSAVVVLFYLSLVLPVVEQWGKYADAADRFEFKLERYKKIAAGSPSVEKFFNEVRQGHNSTSHFISGKNSSLVSAELQTRVKELIKAGGGQLTSTQVLSSRPEEGFERIAIKVRMSGDMNMLSDVIYDIESTKPMMFIDNLTIRPVRGRRDRKTRKILPSGRVNVNLDVVGYMRSGGQ